MARFFSFLDPAAIDPEISLSRSRSYFESRIGQRLQNSSFVSHLFMVRPNAWLA
jgi:hypothetical protein